MIEKLVTNAQTSSLDLSVDVMMDTTTRQLQELAMVSHEVFLMQ